MKTTHLRKQMTQPKGTYLLPFLLTHLLQASHPFRFQLTPSFLQFIKTTYQCLPNDSKTIVVLSVKTLFFSEVKINFPKKTVIFK
eukprot:m.153893 g.153893  ORF g.153893 m.153893 type:complete len:85 (+) comp38629_c1_seq3:869-1123(+)